MPQDSQSLPQTPAAARHTGHLQTQRHQVRKLSPYSVSLSHINSHAQCLILHKLPLNIATRKTQLSPNTMVSGLCPLLSRHCEHLGILGWAPFPELQGQGWAVFHEPRDPICMSASYILSSQFEQ